MNVKIVAEAFAVVCAPGIRSPYLWEFGYRFSIRMPEKSFDVLAWTWKKQKKLGNVDAAQIKQRYIPQNPWKHGKTEVLIAGLKAMGYQVELVVR